MKKTLFTVTVLLLVVAFGVSAFMVGNYLLDGKKQEDRMDQLSQIVSDAQTETAASKAEETTAGTTEETWPTSMFSFTTWVTWFSAATCSTCSITCMTIPSSCIGGYLASAFFACL